MEYGVRSTCMYVHAPSRTAARGQGTPCATFGHHPQLCRLSGSTLSICMALVLPPLGALGSEIDSVVRSMRVH